MADLLNTPTFPKTHPVLSRRALMREMAAVSMLTAAPAAAANISTASPQERLAALVKEIQAVAAEITPTIEEWKVCINLESELHGCPLVIAAFRPHPNGRARPSLAVGWTYSHGGQS